MLGNGEVEAWRTFRGNEWGNKGEKIVVSAGGEGWVKVEGLRALGGKEYLIQRQGCKFSFSLSFHLLLFSFSVLFVHIFNSSLYLYCITLLLYKLIKDNISLTTIDPQKPNDAYCWCLYDYRLWHAVSNG